MKKSSLSPFFLSPFFKAKLKELLHKPVDIVFHSNFDRVIEEEALKGVRL
jgi:endonuclease/exonuclease/phosphatase (EEP) superfamily protein YafD